MTARYRLAQVWRRLCGDNSRGRTRNETERQSRDGGAEDRDAAAHHERTVERSTLLEAVRGKAPATTTAPATLKSGFSRAFTADAHARTSAGDAGRQGWPAAEGPAEQASSAVAAEKAKSSVRSAAWLS